MRVKRKLPRRSFWGIVLVTLLCLPLSRLEKEYLLQRRFFLQPKTTHMCPRETVLNGPLFKLSPYTDLLSGKGSAASDSTSLDHTPLSVPAVSKERAKCLYNSPASLSNMKLLRVEVTVVIIQHLIQPTFCTTYPTVCSQQSGHLNQEASGSARVIW